MRGGAPSPLRGRHFPKVSPPSPTLSGGRYSISEGFFRSFTLPEEGFHSPLSSLEIGTPLLLKAYVL
ncbi:MAG: hypothetical protein C6I05_04820 [Epsilonproteobacteria bacterium]|nr:hypothetical protein [Campylobacterota bacterium]